MRRTVSTHEKAPVAAKVVARGRARRIYQNIRNHCDIHLIFVVRLWTKCCLRCELGGARRQCSSQCCSPVATWEWHAAVPAGHATELCFCVYSKHWRARGQLRLNVQAEATAQHLETVRWAPQMADEACAADAARPRTPIVDGQVDLCDARAQREANIIATIPSLTRIKAGGPDGMTAEMLWAEVIETVREIWDDECGSMGSEARVIGTQETRPDAAANSPSMHWQRYPAMMEEHIWPTQDGPRSAADVVHFMRWAHAGPLGIHRARGHVWLAGSGHGI